MKEYYEDNKEHHKQYTKEYYENNKEKILKYRKQYRKDNKEKILEYTKDWMKDKYHTDPLYKFKANLRSRTSKAFKSKSWIKGGGSEKLLGCDWETAMKHIESQFESWMNWDNHGEWHIDHIIPLSSATTKEEVKKLCHYTNLQPLLAEENITKGDKILN
jgi:hypothetical protein